MAQPSCLVKTLDRKKPGRLMQSGCDVISMDNVSLLPNKDVYQTVVFRNDFQVSSNQHAVSPT